jgi:hypothetical protein
MHFTSVARSTISCLSWFAWRPIVIGLKLSTVPSSRQRCHLCRLLGLGQLSHRDPKVSSCPLYIAHAPVTSITAPCQLTPPVSILLCATFRVAQHLKASVRRRTGEQTFCHMTYYYIVPGPGPTALDAVYFLRAISHRRDAGSGSF